MSHSPSIPDDWSPTHRFTEPDGHNELASSSSLRRTKPTKRQRCSPPRDQPVRHRCINACNRCKLKKLKCYRLDESFVNCAACVKASEVCVFEDIVMRPGYTKYIVALENRCAKLEKALFEIMPDHPEIKDHYMSQRTDTPIKPSGLPYGENAKPQKTLPFTTTRTALSGLLHSDPHMRIPPT
ncbi:hypothetical protein I203_100003 [Kwoniella mangroviensis CBS 8507]|uniref:uncharacterized protein n=1 Tax=Kwoniella mangroviensis CBS 8507 TaxID=1296122 RepID=UPI00305E8B09